MLASLNGGLNLHTEEYAEVQDMLARLNGGVNLHAEDGPLQAPEWDIDVDHAAGEEMA